MMRAISVLYFRIIRCFFERSTFLILCNDVFFLAEYNLVCDRGYLRPLFQVSYTLGNIIGSPITGVLSDKLGRKTIVLITATFGTLSVFGSFLAKDIILVILARFLYGICFHPLMLTSYTLAMEVCEPKLRSVYGIMHTLPWAFGTMWWGCLGYLIRDWRLLQCAALLPIVCLFIMLCIIDESPRWLIVNGQLDQSLKCLRKASKWNKKPLPQDEELLKSLKEIEMAFIERKPKTEDSHNTWKTWICKRIKTVLNLVVILFRTSELRRITCLMCFSFFVAGAVFYGMALNASNFDLNPYFYIVVVGLTEIPAYALTGHIIKRFGRIYPGVIFLLASGVTVLILAFLPQDVKWAVIIFAFLGNLAIASGFQVIFVLGNEVFPTEVRSQGFGLSHFMSSVGTVVAPFINEYLGMYYSWAPALAFGIMATIAGIAAGYLPETLNRRMYETIEELERDHKKKLEQERGNFAKNEMTRF